MERQRCIITPWSLFVVTPKQRLQHTIAWRQTIPCRCLCLWRERQEASPQNWRPREASSQSLKAGILLSEQQLPLPCWRIAVFGLSRLSCSQHGPHVLDAGLLGSTVQCQEPVSSSQNKIQLAFPKEGDLGGGLKVPPPAIEVPQSNTQTVVLCRLVFSKSPASVSSLPRHFQGLCMSYRNGRKKPHLSV